MGDCGAASTPDVNSMHWNAAKYAFIEKKTGFDDIIIMRTNKPINYIIISRKLYNLIHPRV